MRARSPADPALSAMFPAHHGLLHIHALPAPHTLLPPSDRFSTLRGIALASGAAGGGENNLAFKCMRKRLVFETLHLDVEGGVGERRTTPAARAAALDEALVHGHDHGHDQEDAHAHAEGPAAESQPERAAGARVEVKIEEADKKTEAGQGNQPQSKAKGKAKKKVAFRTDRPDLYDF